MCSTCDSQGDCASHLSRCGANRVQCRSLTPLDGLSCYSALSDTLLYFPVHAFEFRRDNLYGHIQIPAGFRRFLFLRLCFTPNWSEGEQLAAVRTGALRSWGEVPEDLNGWWGRSWGWDGREAGAAVAGARQVTCEGWCQVSCAGLTSRWSTPCPLRWELCREAEPNGECRGRPDVPWTDCARKVERSGVRSGRWRGSGGQGSWREGWEELVSSSIIIVKNFTIYQKSEAAHHHSCPMAAGTSFTNSVASKKMYLWAPQGCRQGAGRASSFRRLQGTVLALGDFPASSSRWGAHVPSSRPQHCHSP